MSLLSPVWLTTALMGLAVLSLPVIIHYLFRSRYRVVNWAAMDFLRKSMEETSRRIQFRELLLMLLRIALLALLVFALMRPSSRSKQGDANTPVDAVFIVDVSASMAITEGKTTRLNDAKEAALSMLATLPSQSTVHILQTGQHVIDLGPASPTNRDQARFILEHLEQSHEALHLLPALRQAEAILSRGSLANKEVYLFSDMQRSDWNNAGTDLNQAWASLQEQGQAILVQTRHAAQPANASLTNLRPQVALPLPGDRVPFLVEVRNTGTSTLQGLTVTLQGTNADRDTDTQTVPPLKPGETVALTLTTRLELRGKNVVTAELQGDELAIDNKLQVIVETRDRLKVLIVDGQLNNTDPAQSASFFLAHALRSLRGPSQLEASPAVDLRIVSAAEVYPAQLAEMQVCFLVGLGMSPTGKVSPEFADRLISFVQQGGGLITFAGGTMAEMGLEKLADQAHGLRSLFPGTWEQTFNALPTTPVTFDIQSIPTGSFLNAFRFAPLDRLKQTETTLGRKIINMTSDAIVALKFSNGLPVLVYRTEGLGTLIMLGIRADLLSSDAPLRPGFVPWVQSMVGLVLAQQSGKKNLVAGDTYAWSPVLEHLQQRFTLVTPQQAALVPLGSPHLKQNRLQLFTAHTNQAGVYRIIPEGVQAEETGQDSSLIDLFAIVPDANETANLATLSAEELQEKFTTAPVILATDSLSSTGHDRSRIQHEWTPRLWWLLLGVLAAELAFGWYCNREV